MAKTLKIIFLGGVGEIGKNMTALEYGDSIIVIDCGMSFPNEDTPGIDAVIPDVTYLKQNQDKIKGIVLTHGHEDHIGALPHILKELKVPIYGTKLTLAIVAHKLSEYNMDLSVLHNVEAGDTVNLGCFSVEFIKVCHSIAEASSLAVNTPLGVVFFTGDFKFDFTPIDGKLTDVARISAIGKKGVALMLSDSTNVEREGHSTSESAVGKSLDVIFSQNSDRRLIVATFSTNNYRVQQLINLASKYGRKVAFSGRSMKNVAEMAHEIGELNYDDDIIVDIDKANKLPPERVLILCTGSQGEPMSALSRMAQGGFNKITVGKTDTVVLSSSPIPGNERMIYNVINNLYRLGAEVIYEAMREIHVSGHAFREELKLMISLVKPKYFIPVHGEYRHLKKHALLAESMGIGRENIVIPEIGNVIGLQKGKLVKMSNVPAGNNFVDGIALGENAEDILRDRKALSDGGFIIVLTTIRFKTGEVISGPDIITRGLHFGDSFSDEAKAAVVEAISKIDFTTVEDYYDIKATIRKTLRKFIANTYKQYPMILPIIIEG